MLCVDDPISMYGEGTKRGWMHVMLISLLPRRQPESIVLDATSLYYVLWTLGEDNHVPSSRTELL